MIVWGGTNFVTEAPVEVEPIAPGVGRIVCLECDGDPEGYAASFPSRLGIDTCIDCKGRGWVYVSA
jgi:hypothetical protein